MHFPSTLQRNATALLSEYSTLLRLHHGVIFRPLSDTLSFYLSGPILRSWVGIQNKNSCTCPSVQVPSWDNAPFCDTSLFK